MDSSLRAVTVETPSVQEQEYIDDDAIKRLSTSSRSNRGNRRSVTFADASTQGGFEDQRVNNAMQLEQKTVDDHDEKKKSKRNAMNTMSRPWWKPRPEEKDKKKRRTSRERKKNEIIKNFPPLPPIIPNLTLPPGARFGDEGKKSVERFWITNVLLSL